MQPFAPRSLRFSRLQRVAQIGDNAAMQTFAFASVLSLVVVGCGGEENRCDDPQPDTICTIAGTGDRGFAGDGGPATQAALYMPWDIAVAPDGELWIVDFNNFVVRAVDNRGAIRTVVGTGELGASPEDSGHTEIPALEARLNHSTDLLFHDGHAYIAAWHNSQIKRVRLSDMMLETFAGSGRRAHYDGDGGPARDASLDLPASLAVAPDGALAVLDQGNQVIRRIDTTGTISTLAGQCIASEVCDAGEEPATCPDSHKRACGTSADRCDHPCMPGFAGDGELALAARLGQPYGAASDPGGHMAYDRDGNLVIADTDNHRIRKIDRAGIITTIAGTGAPGHAGDGGPAALAQLDSPHDLAIADDGTIYFTDVMNHCVRRIDPAGRIWPAVGVCDPAFRGVDDSTPGALGDGGPVLEARLYRPYGIALVGSTLYVSDTFHGRVRAANLAR